MARQTYSIDDEGRVRPHVLKPSWVAEILGLDPATVYRRIANGTYTDAFADDEGSRKGIPAWQIEQIINAGRAGCGCACHQSPSASVVGAGVAGPPPSLPAAVGGGGPHLRSVGGGPAPSAA